MTCRERLEGHLREHGVPYQVTEHPLAYTAQEVAASEHVKGRMFAKVVIALVDGVMTMLVLPASERIRADRARVALGASDVRLAHESEFAARFPDCEPGAMPPFGELYGLAMIVDASFARNDRIVFQAGTHTTTMSVSWSDYLRAVHPRLAEIGTEPADTPTPAGRR